MLKLDLKKELKELYSPSSKEVSVVKVPKLQYLMIDGIGAPDSKEAKQAIETLFPISYKIKFLSKKKDKDYVVMPLEGLWWADNMNAFINNKRENWKWTYMIMQPEFISQEDFQSAIKEVKLKKDLPSINKVRLEQLEEGEVAQILHIGPFSEEGANIQKIHKHIESISGKFEGKVQKHHEIYLSDFRKVAREKMKVILRQPFTIR